MKVREHDHRALTFPSPAALEPLVGAINHAVDERRYRPRGARY
jgi:hypothetical protein